MLQLAKTLVVPAQFINVRNVQMTGDETDSGTQPYLFGSYGKKTCDEVK
jgi:hypothetical protein